MDIVHLDNLPTVSTSLETSLSADHLSAPLSEEEIKTAISDLRPVKVPGLDSVTLERLRLDGEETILWLKSIFDTVWQLCLFQR